jgi:aspartyl-tRNA(Asn)/glutamyl-tRNA(Gln) amidotransferase subunit B
MTLPRAGGAMRIGVTRVHLEEDAGKSLHHGFPDSDRATYLDFNRSGVPLVEIVTEPDVRSAADAAACFSRVREMLVALGVNDGNMEEGSLRCDANISVRPVGADAFGVKTEVKNVNSFRFVQKAIEFEVDRQIATLSAGGAILQETRLWNSDTGETESMRTKEAAHDYRYFPEPDLPPLVVPAAWLSAIRASMAELPDARRARLAAEYGLTEYDAAIIGRSSLAAVYFEAMVRAGASAKAAANWLQGEVRRKLKDIGRDEDMSAVPFSEDALAELAVATERGVVSSTAAKMVFEQMWTTGRSARAIIDAEGLAQIGDASALEALVADVLANHPGAMAEFRAGRKNAFGFLVGQVMKASQGKANPNVINDLLLKALSARER